MEFFKQKEELIKRFNNFTLPKDFGFNSYSYFIFVICLAAGIVVQFLTEGMLEQLKLVSFIVSTIMAMFMLTIFKVWNVVILFIIASWAGMYIRIGGNFYPLYISLVAGLVFAPSFQLVQHWDKVVVLRLGKFRKVHGPGLFFLFPFIDRITGFIDTRIRVTDFRAEKMLTTDTVPVDVDALCFWMVWDAKKAVLEVENFLEAVILSAQTALRDGIGKHELSDLLSDREHIGREIQQILDAKTNPWGITILSIEMTDIIIPKNLEDALSKRAQAERERQSRVILGDAEIAVADKFREAAKRYETNPTALHLRAMNMIYEGLKKQGSIMLIPSQALDSMSLGASIGAFALGKSDELLKQSRKTEADDSPEDAAIDTYKGGDK
jgi:regulator of protease activity HflC (stomatin/prohibitin superfamily)